MRQLYLLLILLGLGWLGLRAQAPGSVYLRTGEERFPANLSAFLAQEPSPAEWVEGRYYRFIQFQATPTAAVHRRLAELDVKLLEYIPKATYLASLPVGLDRQALADLQIHSVLKPQGMQKIAPLLMEGAFPDWALEGQDIHLVVAFPQDLAPETGAKLLAAWGASMDKAPTYDGTVEVMINVNQIFALADLPYVTWVEAISPPGEPEDRGGRALSRANVISPNFGPGVSYDGTGIRVMVRDDGSVGPHIDFEGRIKLNVVGGGIGTHGDGVASMMAATGNLNPKASGTAPGAEIYVLNYESTFTDNTLALHQTDSVMITNSSYSDGCNDYTAITRRVDEQSIQNPNLLHVFSAGNSNGNNCGYGAGSQWGNITGGHKQGKNVVAVANLFPDGSLVGSSSRGPAHDGRIKPDLAANGNGQIRSLPNQTYGTFSGTSAAAPTAAGSFAQLYQAYRDLHNNEYPESALIKAMMMNSAEDYGVPGPDFQYGWGRVNAARAFD
ncbi:MAG: S8 family serine peptidase, partial [Bacteroidota bacterium]